MLNLRSAIDVAAQAATAARMSSGRGAILPSATATPQLRIEPVVLYAPPRASRDAGLTGQPGLRRIAANPSLTGVGHLGDQVLPAGPRDASVQCTFGKQNPYTTRFAAPSGDAEGPHPARDPV
jgi:hypothetical protein